MEIRVEAHGPHVAVVTIDNQPRRNAMTRQMMAELAAQWDALEQAELSLHRPDRRRRPGLSARAPTWPATSPPIPRWPPSSTTPC
jgi:hypothetical protein